MHAQPWSLAGYLARARMDIDMARLAIGPHNHVRRRRPVQRRAECHDARLRVMRRNGGPDLTPADRALGTRR